MNSNSVHLIATDPPFNKGRDFHATPDSLTSGASFHDRWSWDKDVHQEWVDQIKDDWPHVMNVIEGSKHSYGENMGAFLCYMAVRLLAMRRVLRDDGSIYFHCDHTASHYLKELMDAVFGKKNFLGEIIWNKQNGVKTKKSWGNENENILCYAKRYGKHTFNSKESSCRKPFSDMSLQMHFKNKDAEGRLYRERKIGGRSYIYYADEGRFIGNLWNDIPSMQANTPLQRENTGYPTQKPLSLYERIVRASSNENDIVLDPFAGCATTCVVAEMLGRQWVGIDIWDKAHEVVVNRLEAEGLLGGHRLGSVHFTNEPPERTDDGETVVPFLKTKKRVDEPKDQRMTRAEMLAFLLEQSGPVCQGCGRKFDDPRYLELDHNTPRADGGINHISNRILLCGPCNRAKSHTLTLSGLRKLNEQNGWMAV